LSEIAWGGMQAFLSLFPEFDYFSPHLFKVCHFLSPHILWFHMIWQLQYDSLLSLN